MTTEYAVAPQPSPYAGFWLRAGAFVIDTIIISIPTWIVSIPLFIYAFLTLGPLIEQSEQANELPPEAISTMLTLWAIGLLIQLMWVILFWLYFALFESSKKQATWGKQIVGIKVTGMNGEPISFGRATGRTFSKFISYLVLYIGFIMVAFTEKKQGLHDMIANTLVVKK